MSLYSATWLALTHVSQVFHFRAVTLPSNSSSPPTVRKTEASSMLLLQILGEHNATSCLLPLKRLVWSHDSYKRRRVHGYDLQTGENRVWVVAKLAAVEHCAKLHPKNRHFSVSNTFAVLLSVDTRIIHLWVIIIIIISVRYQCCGAAWRHTVEWLVKWRSVNRKFK